MILQENFAYATTAQLSRHVQNFLGITSLQQNQISITFELWWEHC